MEDHPLARGAFFSLGERVELFTELSNWYGDAALCLRKLAAPVRCWPPHFDIAGQIVTGDGSIGAGLSPGDGSYSEPDFYVSPGPIRKRSAFQPWRGVIGIPIKWTGAVLTSGEILREEAQQRFAEAFLDEVVAVLG